MEGIRVLAVEQYLAGPIGTMWLGDLGAEVIKIEPPGKGEPRRGLPPTMKNDKGETISGAFMEINRNKKSVSLDLKNEQGNRIFKELVKHADVVFENMRPGAMERLGLHYPALREVNPRIIYAALSGFGQMEGYRGPYWDRPAFDSVIQAMGGVMERIGEEGGPPMLGVSGTSDRLSGVVAGYGILAALFMRERTGVGQFVDLAMYDSILLLNERAISMYSLTGTVLTRGKEEPNAPLGAYKVKDGWIGIIVPGEEMWGRFCRAIDRPDLVEHPLCKGTMVRVRNYKTFLRPIVEEWMAARTKDEVIEKLLANGVPVGVVQTIPDLFLCPQVEARHMLVEVDDPVAGKRRFANTPFRFSEVPEVPPVRPPRLGEHNHEILGGLLGYSDDELNRLHGAGVL